MSDWYTKTVEYTLKRFDTTDHGLSSDEAARRLQRDGQNRLEVRSVPLWRKIIEPFMSVFMGVLVLAIILSVVTGHLLDAVIIGVIIFVSAAVYYVQTISTERVLRALRKHETQMVHVMRDGDGVEIPGEQIVIGDVVIVSEGEKVPADLRIISDKSVRVDEAMLTGESLPIDKHTHALQGEKPVYERTNMLFQGSYVVAGQAHGIVVAVANQTEYGKLAELSVPEMERSPVQQKIDQLIQQIIIGIAIIVVLVLALELWRGIEFFEALRFVMALAVSAVPEGLPIAIAVVLVLGMRRLAKYKALARNPGAVETIGILTTIASDKTGTLTKNKLSVQEAWSSDASLDQDDLARWALLAANQTEGASDPLDAACQAFAHDRSIVTPRNYRQLATFPFDQQLALSGNVWQHGQSKTLVLKGAPESIIRRSYDQGSAEQVAAEQQLQAMTKQGYRVIGLASTDQSIKPGAELADIELSHMKFIGLIGIADELRPEAKSAIAKARQAGITVRMITGDHAQTAFAIGQQLGLVDNPEQVLDCREIDQLSERELRQKVRDIRVFARVVPEAKHRILGVLKSQDITAMTGDGVNDVPALTNAHLGIAMGSGSQIAKEAGDIVLLDDNFASVVRGVEGGRVIFDNIRRMLFHLLATSLGEVLLIIAALVIGLPLPLVAIQILWVNLVTDTTFEIPLGLEPAEDDVMRRPPRGAKQSILDGDLLVRFILVAVTIAGLTLGAFWYFLETHGVDYARTIAFTVLAVTQWANAINARSDLSSFLVRMRVISWPFVIGFSLAVILQLAVLFTPLADFMYVVPVQVIDLAVASGISFGAILLVGELHKLYCRLRIHRQPT